MNGVVTYYDTEADWAAGLADALATCLRAACDARGRASLAVAGGSTPGPVFDRLAQADLDWDRVSVLPSDERCVPPDDPDANARLISERLLTGRARAAHLVRLYRAGQTPEAAADTVLPAVTALLPLDAVLLGMGTDGHIASLFPGARGLNRALAPDSPALVPIYRADGGYPRITLSMSALTGAGCLHLALRGAEKRDTFEQARHPGRLEDMPVRGVLDRALIHWAP